MKHHSGDFVRSFIFLFCICHIQLQVDGQSECELSVRPGTVADSWQSSSFKDPNTALYCFKNSTDEMANTFKYFHSEVGKESDNNGFHWFVLKLKDLTAVTSVVIKSRDRDPGNTNQTLLKDLHSRSTNIEIWSSASENLSFGSNHCSSREISSQFEIIKDTNWRFCGRTPSSNNFKTGQQFYVNCKNVQLTRFLLLRKFVGNVTRDNARCMGFSDMRINKISIKAEIHPSGSLIQNSRVNILCSKSCFTANMKIPHLSLCYPNGQCHDSLETQIGSLQPSDAGNYTCQIDGNVISSKMLIVLYPTSGLKISASPYGQTRCKNQTVDVTFTFVSSEAYPVPVHLCTAYDWLKNDPVKMKQLSEHKDSVSSNGYVKSHWLCANCSSAVNLTVNCSAVQHDLWNMHAQFQYLSCWNSESESGKLFHSFYISVAAGATVFLLIISLALIWFCFLKRKRTWRASMVVNQPENESTELSNIQHQPASSDAALSGDEGQVDNAKSKACSAVESASVNNDIQLECPVNQADVECSYLSVMRRQSQQMSMASLAASDATVYLEIVRDGDT